MSESFNAGHLKKILPNLTEPERNFTELEKALKEFGIGTRDRVAHLLGQVGGETEGGRYFEEIGDEAYFRSFLGAQWMYHGRGGIMVTWRDTYEKLAAYFRNPKLLKQPDLIKTPEWRWRTACWFWTVYKIRNGRNINYYADRVDFDTVMEMVLGTSQHASREKRWGYYIKACQVLPIPWILDGQLRTRGDRGLAYLWPALGKIDYDWWLRGNVPDGPMAYAKNAPPPDIEQVIRDNAMFCAAPSTLMLREVGKVIPTKGDPRYDGGIAAYWGGVYGPGYFHEYREPYDPDEDYPHLTLCGGEFWNSSRQGHNGIILGNGRMLDCNSVEGLQARNWHSTQGPRFDMRYVVMPWNWVNYVGDERAA